MSINSKKPDYVLIFEIFKNTIKSFSQSGLSAEKHIKDRLSTCLMLRYADVSDKNLSVPQAWIKYFQTIKYQLDVRIERNALDDTETVFVQNNILDKWGKSKGLKLPLALLCYYYAHICDDELFNVAAKEIDMDIFGATFKKKFEMNVPKSTEQALQLQRKKEVKPNRLPKKHGPKEIDLNPTLVPAPIRGEFYHYAYDGEDKIPVLGRKLAQDKLREFASGDPGYLWLQLAGEAGQGKSRLAWELIKEMDKKGWAAGFWNVPKNLKSNEAKRDFLCSWENWTPDRPHLLVLDYIVALGSIVGPIMETFMERAKTFKHPVRLLLIERQRWDQGGFAKRISNLVPENHSMQFIPSDGMAGWFDDLNKATKLKYLTNPEFMFEKIGVFELGRLLPDDLVKITRTVFETMNHQELIKTNVEIECMLQNIDKEGRPLYAFFLGTILSSRDPVNIWTKNELLNRVMDKEQNRHWATVYSDNTSSMSITGVAMAAAVLSTLSGGCSIGQLRDVLDEDLDEDDLRKALILVNGPFENNVLGSTKFLPPLSPHILGEWFVLNTLDLCGKKSGERLVQQAWSLSPTGMSQFITRVVSDFPALAKLSSVLEKPSLTAHYLDHFSTISPQVTSSLLKAKETIPNTILEALQTTAKGGDAIAMRYLGCIFQKGYGIHKNDKGATKWWKKAAKAGDITSMTQLGLCYRFAYGVDQDCTKAVKWWKNAAKSRDAAAMTNLGSAYGNGSGVDMNLIKAREWYYKAAMAGETSAMLHLGIYLKTGYGGIMNAAEAVKWWRKAAKGGNTTAMRYVATSYKSGEGVDKDDVAAEKWWRYAIAAGDKIARSLRPELCTAVAPLVNLSGERQDQLLLNANWRDVNYMETLDIATKLAAASNLTGKPYAFEGLSITSVQKTNIPCYEKLVLVNIQLISASNEPLFVSALISDNEAFLLDGLSYRIYKFNSIFLSLDTFEKRVAYLRFFCEFSGGDLGPFKIVEAIDDIQFYSSNATWMLHESGVKINPIQFLNTSQQDAPYVAKATMLYRFKLYEVEFSIADNGRVDMLNDVQLTGNLPTLRLQYRGIFRSILAQEFE